MRGWGDQWEQGAMRWWLGTGQLDAVGVVEEDDYGRGCRL